MLQKFTFYRLLAIPACLAWGIHELVALQRAYWSSRRA